MTSARKALLLAVTGAVLLGLSTSAAALSQNATQSSEVNVSVTSEVAVDLHPQSLEYEATDVGALNTTTDRGFDQLTLENVGSEYIDNIWVNATTPSSDPFGTGNANNYDAGNFLVLKPNNASGKLVGNSDVYNFVNRVEFGTYTQAEIPSYINAPADGSYVDANGDALSGVQNITVGRFRIGDEEYFWAIPLGNSDPGTAQCDGGGLNTLYVAKEPHTASDTVPVDFTDGNGFPAISGTDYETYNITETGEVSGGGVTETQLELTADGSNQRNYGLITSCPAGASELTRTRYNIEAGGASDLSTEEGATDYLLDTSVDGEMLQPGEFVEFDVGIEVPRGVPEGSVTSGKLTVSVTADSTATTDP